MNLESILAIFLFRYLQKSLKTEASIFKWNKILTVGLAVSIGLLVAQLTIRQSRLLTEWLTHAVLLTIIFMVNKQEEFKPAKPVLYAILPYILLSVVGDIVKIINRDFYYDWSSFKTAELFAVIWMFAMWLINRNQKRRWKKNIKK